MQEISKSNQKSSKLPLSPIPIRKNCFLIYKKANTTSKRKHNPEKLYDLVFRDDSDISRTNLAISSKTYYSFFYTINNLI